MPTPPKDVPVEEAQACALGCANWLRAEGFINADPAFDQASANVLFQIDPALNGSSRACAVFGIYVWLWVDILPAIDGRREAERQRVVARSAIPALPDPPAAADLYFGGHERDLAERIRLINASIQHLAADVERAAERQKARVITKGSEDGTRLREIFEAWRSLGGRLRNMVEPAIPDHGPRPIPHTLKEWQEARIDMEARLHRVGISDPDIARILPCGGGPEEVYRRRYRNPQE